MRRTLLCLTLLVGVLFTIGAAPGTASAANCSTFLAYGQNTFAPPTYYAQVGNCTDVQDIQWVYWPGAGYSYTTGWFDGACNGGTGCFANGKIAGCYCDFTKHNPGSSLWSVPISAPCWFTGGHALLPGFFWRIKGQVWPVWGPYHYTSAPGYTAVFC